MILVYMPKQLDLDTLIPIWALCFYQTLLKQPSSMQCKMAVTRRNFVRATPDTAVETLLRWSQRGALADATCSSMESSRDAHGYLESNVTTLFHHQTANSRDIMDIYTELSPSSHYITTNHIVSGTKESRVKSLIQDI